MKNSLLSKNNLALLTSTAALVISLSIPTASCAQAGELLKQLKKAHRQEAQSAAAQKTNAQLEAKVRALEAAQHSQPSAPAISQQEKTELEGKIQALEAQVTQLKNLLAKGGSLPPETDQQKKVDEETTHFIEQLKAAPQETTVADLQALIAKVETTEAAQSVIDLNN